MLHLPCTSYLRYLRICSELHMLLEIGRKVGHSRTLNAYRNRKEMKKKVLILSYYLW